MIALCISTLYKLVHAVFCALKFTYFSTKACFILHTCPVVTGTAGAPPFPDDPPLMDGGSPPTGSGGGGGVGGGDSLGSSLRASSTSSLMLPRVGPSFPRRTVQV